MIVVKYDPVLCFEIENISTHRIVIKIIIKKNVKTICCFRLNHIKCKARKEIRLKVDCLTNIMRFQGSFMFHQKLKGKK